MAVVIYHAFPEALRGGFCGVDIFFVISGYLISSILYRNLAYENALGRLNLVDFYIRRIRRIFPALIAVLIFTLSVGWFALYPDEYELAGKHILGGATYVSNFLLYFESGDYFDASSNAKPLLHLWSLGVEEQFYLIFPVLLWMLYKLGLGIFRSLALFGAISFGLNLYYIYAEHQTAAFYLPWARFWELSAGAMLAYRVNCHTLSGGAIILRVRRFPNLISALGLLMIVLGAFLVKNDLTFPGWKALLPVSGALMIIGAGPEAMINRKFLSNRVMVFLGLISYPLYLWHWPLLSLAYIHEGRVPATWMRIVAVSLAVVLAALTFLFLEPRLRYGKHGRTKALALLFTLLLMGFLGYRVMATDGFANRFKTELSAEQLEIQAHTVKYLHNTHFNLYDIYIDNCKAVYDHWNDEDPWTTCAFQRKSGDNNIALIGSSHAAHLFYGLSKLAERDGNAIAMFSMGSQSSFINLKTAIQQRSDWYKRITDGYDYILKHPNLEVVVMANISGNYVDLEHPTEKDYRKIVRAGAARSFELLKDRQIIVVLDSPEIPFEPFSCGIRRPAESINCTFDRKETLGKRDIDAEIITEVAREYPNVSIVDLDELFCKNGKCGAMIKADLVYWDRSHLNYKGSNYVAPYIYSKIKAALAAK